MTMSEDEAWTDGYQCADEEWQEFTRQQGGFILEQSEIIHEMISVFDRRGMWGAVPADLREKLRAYV